MKAIMISTQPQWVSKILSGEKTIEIRKTKPSCELPVKVYIYCTMPKKEENRKPHSWETVWLKSVVAEFTLNEVEQYGFMYSPLMVIDDYVNVEDRTKHLSYKDACMSKREVCIYAYDGQILPRPIYAWHIDDLKIYDTPKELSEFKYWKKDTQCNGWYCKGKSIEASYTLSQLTRPPQSWCYVEELEEEDVKNS